MAATMSDKTIDVNQGPAEADAEREPMEAFIHAIQTYHQAFQNLLARENWEGAEQALSLMVEVIGPEIGMNAKELGRMKAEGHCLIALGRGEREKAVAMMEEGKVSWAKGAEFTICTPGLKTREYAFALECSERALAKERPYPMFLALKARALHALGRKDECLKTLEKIDVDRLDRQFAKPHLELIGAVKSGKPWPKGRYNPDGD